MAGKSPNGEKSWLVSVNPPPFPTGMAEPIGGTGVWQFWQVLQRVYPKTLFAQSIASAA